ncbi:pyridoxamine 5'-phosphate oxidase family protein [Streptomyces sp. NP160]|uniref:pyridoxamine 5'-phosphate oxidase family protein n=1 Tax=Streptomyces sp. NP160 TaxID=2586637 RepID=UPI001118CDC8|nr:pyridoxamine 5'-phosphate oxidase family protein [Streptomyces sp. NP160]TNM70290.1 pyridoxamine 5'-phosphate oxidase family protein [Streptomyces sp. NP160]
MSATAVGTAAVPAPGDRGPGLPAPWTARAFAAVDAHLTAEMATLDRSGTPVAWPVVVLPDPTTGHLTVTTSIGLPVKALNVRRDGRVCLLFSDATGSADPGAPQVLVTGRATCPDVVHADPRGLEEYWRRLFVRQPAGESNSARPLRRLMGWYYLRLVITVVPDTVEVRPALPVASASAPVAPGTRRTRSRRRRGGTPEEQLRAVLVRDGHRTAVLSWPRPDGAPRSVRVLLPEGPAGGGAGGGLVITVPQDEDVQEGPATLLAHSHDELLWNQRVTGAWGTVRRTGDGWRFTPERLAGEFPTSPLGVLAFARRSRATAQRYLQRRGLPRPAVAWDEYEALHAVRPARGRRSSPAWVDPREHREPWVR